MNADKVVELTKNIVTTADFEGNLTYTNPAFHELLGYSKAELQHANFIQYVHPEDVQQANDKFKLLLAGGETIAFETRFVCKNGRIVYLSWNSFIDKDEQIIYGIGNDITHRKLAESELSLETQLLETSQSIAKVGGWELDLLTNELFWTTQTYRIHDTSPEEFDPNVDDGLQFYLPESRETLKEALQLAIATAKGYDLELELKTTKGRHVHVRTTCEVTRKNGRSVKLIGAIQDISEKKRVEKELLESEEKLRAMFDNSLNSILVADDLGNYTFTNKAAADLFGYTEEELVKMNVGQIRTSTPDNATELYNKYLEKGKEVGEFSFTRPDGEQRVAQYHAIRIKADFNLSVLSDVTRNKITEQKLRESEEKYRSLFENAGLGIGYFSTEGIILSFNSVALEALNGVLEDFEGKSVYDIFPKDTADLILNRFQTIFTTGEIHSFEDFVELPSGDQWFLSTYCEITDSNQDTQGIQIISQNITEKKLAERALSESEARVSAILNSLPSSVCVIDEKGKILQVNEAWNEFAQNGDHQRAPQCYADYNYFDVCKADFQDMDAKMVYHGLQKILKGELNEFEHEYPCHTPDREQWFVMRANLMKTKEKKIAIYHIDITSRKLLENTQQKLIEQFNLAVKSGELGLWSLDLTTNKLEWNDQHLEFYGISRDEFEEGINDWQKQLHPDDAEYAQNELNKAFEGESFNKVEFRIIRKDGEIRYLEAAGAPLYNEANELIKVIGMNRDITEQKRKENELLRSDRVFNLAVDMFCIAGFDGYFKYLNPAWERTLGWSTEDLLNNPWIDFVHPDDQNSIEDIKTEIVDGKEVMAFENRYICKDGSVKWLSWKSQPFIDEQIMVGAARDITVLKEQEQKLKQSEAHLKKVQQIAKVGSWYYDLETKTSTWSDELYNIHELDPSEPVPNYEDNSKWFTQESWEVLSEALSKASKEAIPFDLELNIVRKDQSIGWIWAQCEALTNEKGEVYALVGANQDISLKKENMLQLEEAKERAEQADQLKSAFLSNMSHEIRTPLNAIIGFSRLLQDDHASDDLHMYLDQIESNSEQLLMLVDDILNISRIEGKSLEMVYTNVHLHSYIQKIFELHQREIHAHHKNQNVQLKLNRPKVQTEEGLLEVDQIRLKEVFHNLISNAIKFTKNGSVEIGYTCEPHQVTFYVKDEGIGIPEDQYDHIFDRFGQVPGTSELYGGTGLGLAICQGLIEKMGGKIWVESKVNVGSTFWFTLPRISRAALKANPAEPPSIIGTGQPARGVLIADDSASVRLFYKTVMKKHKANAFIVKSGEEAVDYYQQNSENIDLILMDIRMPGIGGIEAMKQIKEINPDIRVIAQTAFAMDDELEKFIKVGFDDCLTKPIPEDDLIRLLKG